MSLCNRCKNKCKIDVIEIESCINFVGEAPHKIVTNFDRITASPEALAEFIEIILDTCRDDMCGCDMCPLVKHCNAGDSFRKIALNWLNEEYKE